MAPPEMERPRSLPGDQGAEHSLNNTTIDYPSFPPKSQAHSAHSAEPRDAVAAARAETLYDLASARAHDPVMVRLFGLLDGHDNGTKKRLVMSARALGIIDDLMTEALILALGLRAH